MRLGDYLQILVKPPLSVLILSSFLAWSVMLISNYRGCIGMSLHCCLAAADSLTLVHRWQSLALGWLLMLVAMMSPLLSEPIMYLWQQSLARHRPRAIAIFLLAYIAVWMIGGVVLIFLAWELKHLDSSGNTPFYLALSIALLWQICPRKRASINRCHQSPNLNPFGLAAIGDCCRYGLTTGWWCMASCWPLMLLPLVSDLAHLLLMAVCQVTAMIERYFTRGY